MRRGWLRRAGCWLRRGGCWLSVTTVVAGCQSASVTRTYAGIPYQERWVHPEAYAAYGAGLRAEAAGKLTEARALFARASELDAGVEPKIRLGAVHCRLGDQAAATGAFSEVEAAAPDAEALWIARAECALGRKDAAAALDATARLLRVSDEPTRVVPIRVRALVLAGRADDARAAARELAARFPLSQAGREATTPPAADAPVDVYAALGAARRRGLTKGGFLVELAASGQCRRIGDDARTWFEAEPSDPDLFAAALFCAVERGDDEAARSIAAHAPVRRASELGGLLLLRLVVASAGPGAARRLAPSFALETPRREPGPEAFRVALKRDVDADR